MKELIKQTNPWASEAESCTTKGRKVVVNRTFVSVVCILERFLVRGMMVIGHFHQATKRSPLASNRIRAGSKSSSMGIA
jgi:hypothetical protein